MSFGLLYGNFNFFSVIWTSLRYFQFLFSHFNFFSVINTLKSMAAGLP